MADTNILINYVSKENLAQYNEQTVSYLKKYTRDQDTNLNISLKNLITTTASNITKDYTKKIDTTNLTLTNHMNDEVVHMTDTKNSNLVTAYQHSQAAHARVDATKVVYTRTLNAGVKIGNIKIDDSENGIDIYTPEIIDNLTTESNDKVLSANMGVTLDSKITELKKYVSDSKANVASAITYMGVKTASDATFDIIVTNIKAISGNTTAEAEHILDGKVVYLKGKYVTGNMPNRGNLTKSINAGSYVDIPDGWYSGGRITANSLASQTVSNAVAHDIILNKTAWVNGTKITGTLNQANIFLPSVAIGTLSSVPITLHRITSANIAQDEGLTISGSGSQISVNLDGYYEISLEFPVHANSGSVTLIFNMNNMPTIRTTGILSLNDKRYAVNIGDGNINLGYEGLSIRTYVSSFVFSGNSSSTSAYYIVLQRSGKNTSITLSNIYLMVFDYGSPTYGNIKDNIIPELTSGTTATPESVMSGRTFWSNGKLYKGTLPKYKFTHYGPVFNDDVFKNKMIESISYDDFYNWSFTMTGNSGSYSMSQNSGSITRGQAYILASSNTSDGYIGVFTSNKVFDLSKFTYVNIKYSIRTVLDNGSYWFRGFVGLSDSNNSSMSTEGEGGASMIVYSQFGTHNTTGTDTCSSTLDVSNLTCSARIAISMVHSGQIQILGITLW